MKPKSSLRSFLALSGSALLAITTAHATQFWDGTAGGDPPDNNWNTAANWGGDTLPDFATAINFGSLSSAAGTAFGNVVVPTVTTTNNNLTAGTLIKSINFGNNGQANRTDAYTLQGNSIVLGDVINNGIVTTPLHGAAIVSSIEDVIELNMDLGTAGTHRQIQTGAKHDLRIDGVISGGVNVGLLLRTTDSKITLTNANNSYLGFTNIAEGTASTAGGVLEITSIANGGSNSSIGASSNAAGNLRFNSGFTDTTLSTLRYIGGTNASTDRLFTIYGNSGLVATNSAIESSGAGTLSFTNSGAIVFSNSGVPRNFYLGGTNIGNNGFNLALGNNGAGVTTFTKQGVGKWIITGTNTYTGATTISEGTLQFAKQVSLYNNNTAGTGWTAANIKVASAATLALNVGGAGEFNTGNVTTLLTNLGGLGGAVASGEGLQAGSRIGFDTTNAGGSFTVADAIADSTGAGGGAIGLTKLGTGTLELTNTNTYTGATLISGGTLLVNGDNSAATGAVTVASGAILGGTGNVGGNTTIQAGGFHAPGVAQDNQDFAGNLTYASTSTFRWEIATASNTYDSVTGTGAGTLSGSGAVFNITSSTAYSTGFWNTNQTWTDIFAGFASDDDWDVMFTSISGADLTWDGTKAVASTGGYFTLSASSLNWTAIPEPTSALAGLLLGAGLLRRRRNG